jgi:chaperonin GroEL
LRIDAIRKKISEVKENSQEEKELKKRLASLTNGVITLRIGGKTFPEIKEKMYRYEDSINATRNAAKDGYVIGGGVTLWDIYQTSWSKYSKDFPAEINDLVKKFCEAPIQQICVNCNQHFPTIISNFTDKIGYNANTERCEDLLKAGIIEPVNVLKMAVENSISVGQIILSSDYIITNKDDESKERK